jgi:GcrA cell cycle regulator
MWGDKQIEALKGLWADGLTASEIAAQMGFTRNSVLGKVHRLGLPPRAVGIRQRVPEWKSMTREERQARADAQARLRRAKRAMAAAGRAFIPPPRIQPPPVVAAPFILALETRPCSLLELNDERCHFPIGEPGEPDFHFCGADTKAESSYCQHHHKITHYRPAHDARTPRMTATWRAA